MKLHEALAQLKEDGSNYAVNILSSGAKLKVICSNEDGYQTFDIEIFKYKKWFPERTYFLPADNWQIVEVRNE